MKGGLALSGTEQSLSSSWFCVDKVLEKYGMSMNEGQNQESDSKERYASDYFGQLYEWAEASH